MEAVFSQFDHHGSGVIDPLEVPTTTRCFSRANGQQCMLPGETCIGTFRPREDWVRCFVLPSVAKSKLVRFAPPERRHFMLSMSYAYKDEKVALVHKIRSIHQ